MKTLIIAITIVLLIALILIIVACITPIGFSDIDESIPVHKISGTLRGRFLHLEIEKSTSVKRIKSVTIKDVRLHLFERISLVLALVNPDFDLFALEGYTENLTDVMATHENDKRHWDEIYKEFDLNDDGIVTRREYVRWTVLQSTPLRFLLLIL